MNISGFDLNLLRVLDALLQEGSTVRAGERVGLSQPAVSSALGRLRQAIGDPLFVRRGQGMEPTEFALKLKRPLSQLLEDIGALLSPEVFDPKTLRRAFRISGSDFFAEVLMPPLAEALARVAPHVNVSLVDLVPDSYIENLNRHDLDLALLPRMVFPDWVEAKTVLRTGYVSVARKGHARLVEAGIQPEDEIPIDLFCDLGHALFSSEGKPTGIGDMALKQINRKRHVVMTLPGFGAVCRAVAESDLIALIPRPLAERFGGVVSADAKLTRVAEVNLTHL